VTGLRLLIVADDLTGALDCACEAAALGIGAAAFVDPGALAGAGDLPPVVAVATGSRDGDRTAAVAAMARVAALLPALAPERVMKKVDSRLKGHPGAETAVLAQALGTDRVRVVPAIPDMGRIQRGGWLSGAGIPRAIDIAAHFPGLQVQVPDIIAPADLDAAAHPGGGLAVGARGLAGALVRRLWPQARPRPAPRLSGPALLVVGSRDPVTLAQVERLRAVPGLDWRAAPNGRLAGTGALRSPLAVLQLTAGAAPVAPARAAADLARSARTLLADGRCATLIATGGETAQALMVALGAQRIALTGMPLPGIAQGLIAPPGRAPLHLVTKSGGFGMADTLMDLTGPIRATATADGTPT